MADTATQTTAVATGNGQAASSSANGGQSAAPVLSAEEIAFLKEALPFKDFISTVRTQGIDGTETLLEAITRENQAAEQARTGASFQQSLGKIAEQRVADENGARSSYEADLRAGASPDEAYQKFLVQVEKITNKHDRAERDLFKTRAEQAEASQGDVAIDRAVRQLAARYPDADPESLRHFARANPKGNLEGEAKRLQGRHDAAISKYAGTKEKQQKDGKAEGTSGESGSRAPERIGPGLRPKVNLDNIQRKDVEDADATIAKWLEGGGLKAA
jgi:hypothetical protein